MLVLYLDNCAIFRLAGFLQDCYHKLTVNNVCIVQGREEGAVIEDWEDPELSLYKSTDRYGFMQ